MMRLGHYCWNTVPSESILCWHVHVVLVYSMKPGIPLFVWPTYTIHAARDTGLSVIS